MKPWLLKCFTQSAEVRLALLETNLLIYPFAD